jgi:hypothetical protein
MRWRYIRRIFELNQPPPQDTFWRCRKHANFAITPAALDIRRMQGGEIVSVRRWAICASTFRSTAPGWPLISACGRNCPPSTVAFLAETPEPDEAAVREALSGNLCRCTGYQHIVDGVLLAARRVAGMR